ncbi:ATP-binding protein [Arachidicoccus terrestris]|uniref:ATP-binding protein n=1 Tax=Arachidicoccus terrestris TaxID=2875539 RepID=UPI001CC819EA|nr:ATP-binding protein [Arachidicoccus terrestris]UAY55489.1 ATP-binding protein [Arachidicoccus terrestris]
MLPKYPIGLQSFREIREGGYVYIDKTEIIHHLVESGKYYFLSRPRRFGKSLLIDTIEELFRGSKTLFEGLWIYDNWNWETTHPVIHFSFSNLGVGTLGLEAAIHRGIQNNAERLGIRLSDTSYDQQFRELIEKVSVRGKVVVLIDEYDKPIIDFLDAPRQMEANRGVMKNFYSILKDSDKYIRFLMITGVTQFSRVSIFSDLNNLRNITLSQQYGDIVGITQKELEMNFKQEIAELQKNNSYILKQIKDWYNGYTWDMKTWVYNPFSLLNFMAEPIFDNYWYETGTPTFLFKLLKNGQFYDVEGMNIGRLDLSTFDIKNADPGPLLFQTGYVTLKDISADNKILELGYPNLEVKESFLNGLLSTYREIYPTGSMPVIDKVKTALKNGNVEQLILQLNSLIATIPYDHWNAGSESIFTVITYLTFKLVGIDVYTEVHSSKGRCDVLVKTDAYIYIIELKLDGAAEEALTQIKSTGYLQPYVADPRKKMAVGISFSSQKRAVAEYHVEAQ